MNSCNDSHSAWSSHPQHRAWKELTRLSTKTITNNKDMPKVDSEVIFALCFVHGPRSYSREEVCKRDGVAGAKNPISTRADHSFTNGQLHPKCEFSKGKSASEAHSLAPPKNVNEALPQSKIRLKLRQTSNADKRPSLLDFSPSQCFLSVLPSRRIISSRRGAPASHIG